MHVSRAIVSAIGLANHRVRAFVWLEALLLTAAVPGVRYALHLPDPLGFELEFPWLVLAPLWIGLHQGLSAALVSAVGLGAALLGSAQLLSDAAPVERLGSLVAACLVLGALGGQFRDGVQFRLDRARRQVGELAGALHRTQRRQRALEVECARAREQLAAASVAEAAWTPALGELRRELSALDDVAQVGESLLRALAARMEVYAASLVMSRPARRKRPWGFGSASARAELSVELVASFGAQVPAVAEHPLVRRAFGTGRLTAVLDGLPGPSMDDSVLAAVPLVGQRGDVVGVVVIHEMAFAAFERRRLQAMFAWLADFADLFADRSPSDEAGVRPARAVLGLRWGVLD